MREAVSRGCSCYVPYTIQSLFSVAELLNSVTECMRPGCDVVIKYCDV